MRIHLEPLQHEHLEFLRTLRNIHRENFFNPKLVSKSGHRKWFRRYNRSGQLFWVIFDDVKPIGSISRRWTSTNCLAYEIGNLMLLPEYQGKGIMLEALREITALAPTAFYVAFVKPDNIASLKLFDKAGFWRVPCAR